RRDENYEATRTSARFSNGGGSGAARGHLGLPSGYVRSCVEQPVPRRSVRESVCPGGRCRKRDHRSTVREFRGGSTARWWVPRVLFHEAKRWPRVRREEDHGRR